MTMPAPAVDVRGDYRVSTIGPPLSKTREPEMLETRRHEAVSRKVNTSRSDAIAGALLLGVTMQVFTGPIGGVIGAIVGAVAGNAVFPRVFPARDAGGEKHVR